MASPTSERQASERQALLAAQKAHADQQKLEKLARSNGCVRDLMNECEKLRAEVAALKGGKSVSKSK